MIEKLRAENPIVHCITNHVVSNFQANGLLAIGASPIMGEAPEEAVELASLSGAVSLNIGTLNAGTLESMLIAGKTANQLGRPVVLDPVGVGATAFRAAAAEKILREVNIAVLRCNAGELAAICGTEWRGKGVDAGSGEADVKQLAVEAANKLGLVVAVTGPIDFVTDGNDLVEIPFGHPLMSAITGSGCLLSAMVAAFLAISPENVLNAVAEALRFYGQAGERAGQSASEPGSFQIEFLNQLSKQSTGHSEHIPGKELQQK
ncbi:Hydroxyethylthiazole kinase [Planococcus massiliensis]|uniref:Hydroxyethylthiazole kinase n=1 Tax=Planococcus massiliensis TaxID=1499687 RepID=A0A098EH18_9BACL|nr:hydroxyethylthiazole kinase [Planococcus massiliensis]CEG21589.1 Hydroxyethylthiazole kinase [Planococcus massiliensis]